MHAAARLAALCAACALLATCVQGHAFLSVPCSRNKIHNSYYEPQSLSAGGPATVYANGATWPVGQHGVCGDRASAPSPRDHEAGGQFANPSAFGAVWEQGSQVTVQVQVTAFHKGGIKMRVCHVPAGADEASVVTQSCFDNGPELQPVGRPDGWWWFPVGGTSGLYTIQYQLPADLTCHSGAKCVVQFWWVTGNSCQPPDESPPTSPQLSMCGTPGAAAPEEFWNCADVLIYPAGTPPPPVEPACDLSGVPPPPPPPASPYPPPSPSPEEAPTPTPEPTPSPEEAPTPTPTPTPSPEDAPTTPSPDSPPPSPSSPPPAGDISPDDLCYGKEVGTFLEDLSDCTKYYHCTPSGAVHQSCGAGTGWDKSLPGCNHLWALDDCPPPSPSPA